MTPPPGGYRPIRGGHHPMLRRARAAGFTVAELATCYGFDPERVAAAICPKVPYARRRPDLSALAPELRRLRAAGWSVPALSERFGIARSTVCRLAPVVTWRAQPARLDDDEAPAPATIAEAVEPAPAPPAGPIESDLYPAPAVASGPWGNFHDAPAIGSVHGRAKLDEGKVAELLRLRASDPRRWTHRALAERFGIARSNVFYVLAGRTWRHVPPPKPGASG